ncbi:MAG: IS21 family transposase [Mycobacteriales bacterium]|nr:IS21 family transposase [Mycobacteriales bacterium]
MLSARKQLDVITAYQRVGSYRGAAEICGVTHKTVKRVIERERAQAVRVERRRNFESVRGTVAHELKETHGKISAKRLLPIARAAGYEGSDRNFRRLVATERAKYRQGQAIAAGRRPAVWAPGEHLVIDWGVLNGLHVFCAVLAYSRVRFVRFATDEKASTTLALLAECFETLGGVPKVVLADRMGCLKGGVVANVVIPSPDYIRFAAHYRFRPDFCEAQDPQSKGIVEALVNYSKSDLMVPLGVVARRFADATDVTEANTAAKAWCAEVNSAVHSEICAVPLERLTEVELPLLAALPSLRPTIGRRELRKVDKLSCIRIGSARYSVPNRMLGNKVEVVAANDRVTIVAPGTGEVLAEHVLVAPGEVSINDDHYGKPRPTSPARKVKGRSAAEKTFLALGDVAEQWLRSAAASGNTRLAVPGRCRAGCRGAARAARVRASRPAVGWRAAAAGAPSRTRSAAFGR